VNNGTLELVRKELESALVGQRFGKIFVLGRRAIAIDFRISGSRYLFISVDPGLPRIYLTRRRIKDLERASENPHPFHLLLKKYLSSAEVISVEKLKDERILLFRCAVISDIGEPAKLTLVAQLTGRSSDLFLFNERGLILGSLIDRDIDGQRIGEHYSAPVRPATQTVTDDRADVQILPDDNESISAALERMYAEREAEERFNSRANNAKRKIQKEISKRRKLVGRLMNDLAEHGDAQEWKRLGDLILANLSTASRRGNKITVVDYFDENVPEIEIEADENQSLTETAQRYFKRYTKAANAKGEIERRMASIEKEIAELESTQAHIELAIAERDEDYFSSEPDKKAAPKEKKAKQRFTGARQFTSSDGFEILVGKKATDNDQLTFKVAGSLDTWLHAADYPGSHVIIRNPNRKEIPHRTLIEAAQLAAFYSSGKTQIKAAVHYTQRKFVNKSKGAAPGLVRLASFKTILVEPSVPTALDQNIIR
jgi:predicted ribosome quality control (RQC) complex YloA/Tae2 family protein